MKNLFTKDILEERVICENEGINFSLRGGRKRLYLYHIDDILETLNSFTQKKECREALLSSYKVLLNSMTTGITKNEFINLLNEEFSKPIYKNEIIEFSNQSKNNFDSRDDIIDNDALERFYELSVLWKLIIPPMMNYLSLTRPKSANKEILELTSKLMNNYQNGGKEIILTLIEELELTRDYNVSIETKKSIIGSFFYDLLVKFKPEKGMERFIKTNITHEVLIFTMPKLY